MKVIGLTGGVGSGKSYVAGLITRNFQILHISTDDIARQQMEPGGASYDAVVENFGREILNEDKSIDRAALGRIVFNNDELLEKLNSITHPNVKKELFRIIDVVRSNRVMSIMYGRPQPYKAVLVETAILKEAGYEEFCDEVWYVHCPLEQRIRRLEKSRGYSREKSLSIIDSQADDEEFLSYATLVIENPDNVVEREIISKVRERFV